jgi:hypothetical protein
VLTVGTFVCHTSYVSGKRTHVLLPEELLHEIDGLVGPRGRSAFIAESARTEVRRQKLLRFLNRTEPAWKDASRTEAGSRILGSRTSAGKRTETQC